MPRRLVQHPAIIRMTHWVNAFAIGCMLMSGWRIYNASPLFDIRFPAWATLGGWLGGAIAWHFAAMWLFVGNAVIYVVYGLVSGRFRRRLLPPGPAAITRDAIDAVRLRLRHTAGEYNAVQRLAYCLVLLCGAAVVVSGVALWKPVQMQDVASALGGYELVRRIHFFAMAGIGGFIVVHLALVALVPRTLIGMITGGSSQAGSGEAAE
jgi:thiosulfate reductase cytochrome b subunit